MRADRQTIKQTDTLVAISNPLPGEVINIVKRTE